VTAIPDPVDAGREEHAVPLDWAHSRVVWVVALIGLGLVALTLQHYGLTANGILWAGAQVLLTFIAAFDFLTRRILNVVLLPAAVAALVLRGAFVPSSLLECCLAGVIAFVCFVVLAVAFRGGLGMGDVKLAGFLGFLLGGAVVAALIGGCVLGGVAAAALIAGGRANRASTFAYGPYLALGAALTIVFGSPPPLY